jgi:ankyrin repeat protein
VGFTALDWATMKKHQRVVVLLLTEHLGAGLHKKLDQVRLLEEDYK